MSNESVNKFLYLVTTIFDFLESDYGYELVDKSVISEDYYPDAEAIVRYKSSLVGVEIFWYFASSVIGVAFVKLERGNFPDNTSSNPILINIYSLVDYLTKGKDDMFLLKETSSASISKIKKREKTINDNMESVLENLSLGIKKYALNIINGDTSIFSAVQNYQLNLLKK